MFRATFSIGGSGRPKSQLNRRCKEEIIPEETAGLDETNWYIRANGMAGDNNDMAVGVETCKGKAHRRCRLFVCSGPVGVYRRVRRRDRILRHEFWVTRRRVSPTIPITPIAHLMTESWKLTPSCVYEPVADLHRTPSVKSQRIQEGRQSHC